MATTRTIPDNKNKAGSRPAPPPLKTEAPKNQQVAVIQPPRIAMPPAIREEFGITDTEWRVLVEATFPSARTAEAIAMVLAYCKKRNLDVFKKPCHIVPIYSTAKRAYVETVWPGISEMRTTAFRTGSYAGMDKPEWGPKVTKVFKGRVSQKNDLGDTSWKEVEVEVTFHEWCEITLYRFVQGHRVSFPGPRVEFEEIFSRLRNDVAVPNERWQKAPVQMHEKTAEAAALRRAFPEELGDEFAAEEAEGMSQRAVDITGEAAATFSNVPAQEPTRDQKPAAQPDPARSEQAAGSQAADSKGPQPPAAGEPGTPSEPAKAPDAPKDKAEAEKPKDKATKKKADDKKPSGPPREAKAPPVTDVQDLNEKAQGGEEPPPPTDPQGDQQNPAQSDQQEDDWDGTFPDFPNFREFNNWSMDFLTAHGRKPADGRKWKEHYAEKIKAFQKHEFKRVQDDTEYLIGLHDDLMRDEG